MTILPLLLLLILLYLAFRFAADLAGLAGHLDQVVLVILSLAVGIEAFSLLAFVCTNLRIFWLAEAFLTITMPVRRLFLLCPGKYPVWLFEVESNCLQKALHEQQKYVRALKVNAFALRMLAKRFGPRSTDVARELINKSFLLSLLGQSAEAEVAATEAIDILKETTEGRQDKVLNLCQAMNNLGALLINQGQGQRAIAVLEESLNISRRSSPVNDVSLATSYANIGFCCLRDKQYASAVRYCRQAIEIANGCPFIPEETKATFHNNLGEALRGQGKLDEAEAELLASLAVRDKILGEMHPHRAYSYHNLGKLRVDQEKFSEAEEYFKKAVLIREKFPGTGGADLRETIEDYGLLLEKMGRSVQAASLRRAHGIKSST